MEFVIFFAAIFLAGFIGYRNGKKSLRPALDLICSAQAHDRMNFFNALRRELANYLIWCDPDRYVSLYKLIHAEISTFKDLEPVKRDARLAKLCEKYKNYEDFDLIATRNYVLYPDSMSSYGLEEIEDRYRDITIFQALMIASNKHWKWFRATSDAELKYLNEYVKRLKDTLAHQRFEMAIREHYIWRAANEAAPNSDFDYGDFSVHSVYDLVEIKYAIHDKKNNEYGLYSFFVADDGKTFNSYRRSDAGFQAERFLDPLRGVLDYTRLHLPRY